MKLLKLNIILPILATFFIYCCFYFSEDHPPLVEVEVVGAYFTCLIATIALTFLYFLFKRVKPFLEHCYK